MAYAQGDHKDDRHGGKNRPALPPVPDHAAESMAEARRDQQNREHLQIARESGGVLEGMRRIGVEEAPAVGAEDLDRFLGRHRPHGDDLLQDGLAIAARDGRKQRGHRVGPQGLHHALAHEDHREDDGQGQKDV